MSATSSLTWSLLTLVACAGCLPADLRPEPSKVMVDVDMPLDLRQMQAVPNAITFPTADGWTITLDRFFVSMGNMMLQGPSCAEYASAWYGRILDLSQPGPQRLGQLWGLNGCRLTFEAMRPSENAVLGAGVTEEDRSYMRHAVVPFANGDQILSDEGMALHVRGNATKDQIQIGFDWGFSTGRRFGECKRVVDGEVEDHLPLVGGDTTEITLGIDPRELFVFIDPTRSPAQPATAELLMQRIADADQVQGNQNGRVSIEELVVPKFTIRDRELNLADVLRLITFPSMFNYGGADSICRLGFADDDGR